MSENEYNNTYAIPANYTDSGKLMGGMLEVRNTIEAVFLIVLVGYPELFWMPVGTTAKVIIMTVTLIPLGVFAIMGVGGDSLLQFVGHMIRYLVRRRKLHFRRIGYRYDPTIVKDKEARRPKGKAKGKQKAAKTSKAGKAPKGKGRAA